MAQRKKPLSPKTLITDAGLSTRTENILFGHSKFFFGKDYVPDLRSNLRLEALEDLSLQKLRGFKGVGKKAVVEIAEICQQAGVLVNENTDLEEYNSFVKIHFTKHTKNGKVLLSLAKLLAENDRDIVINEGD